MIFLSLVILSSSYSHCHIVPNVTICRPNLTYQARVHAFGSIDHHVSSYPPLSKFLMLIIDCFCFRSSIFRIIIYHHYHHPLILTFVWFFRECCIIKHLHHMRLRLAVIIIEPGVIRRIISI